MPSKTSATGKRKNLDKQITEEEKPTKVDISTSDPRTIVLMLDSPELPIICKACEALQKYIEKSEQNVLEVVELDALPRMIKLISSPEEAARCHAILCLCGMAQHAQIRHLLFKSNFIPDLLKLVTADGHTEELMTQERASFLLTLLAEDYCFKVILGQHRAHRQILGLIKSPDPDVQRNCVKVLSQLTENFQLRPAVLEDDGLPLIISLLDSEYAVIQELGLLTLRWNTSSEPLLIMLAPSRQVVANGEGLSKLIEFLGIKECADLHVLAVEVLGYCLADANSMIVLQGSGCLQQLLAHIKESSDPIMKRNATNTLASAAASDLLNKKILHEHQAEKTFIELLSSEDGGQVEAACRVLATMADFHSSRQLIGREGCVSELVKHLDREEDSVRAATVHCLSCLLQESPANCKLLAESGGLEHLVSLLSDSQAICRQFAAECIICVSNDEKVRQALITNGAIPALVGCQTFKDSTVQAGAVQALGMLATDQVARQQYCANGGLESLLQLIQSPSKLVVKNAIWALRVCTQSHDVAAEAGRLGAIDTLEEVSSSGQAHISSLAKSALDGLFSANLPAKYWVTGRLEMTDTILDTEFYDAGPGLSSQPFMSISQLSDESFNKSQPIIIVNLKALPDETISQAQPPLEEVPSNSSSISRSKSRQQTTKKRGRAERETESRLSMDSNEIQSEESKPSLAGLFEVDKRLWEHIQHVQTNVKHLPSTKEQVEQVAKYVSERLGGQVERSGSFTFELHTAHTQSEKKSNLIPLGQLDQGSFQYRALLFKVLCDSLGVPCSLVRGEYSRHWNEVLLEGTSSPSSSSQLKSMGSSKLMLVDLMYIPGGLLQAGSPQAIQYQHI